MLLASYMFIALKLLPTCSYSQAQHSAETRHNTHTHTERHARVEIRTSLSLSSIKNGKGEEARPTGEREWVRGDKKGEREGYLLSN
jgi:hypothetical protein